MKINLIAKDEHVISNYLNLSPFFQKENDEKKCCLLNNLDEFIYDGEAEEIISYYTLKHISFLDIKKVLAHWIKKLKHGGTLTIEEDDGRILARDFSYRRIELDALNYQLYGNEGMKIQKSIVILPYIVGVMRELGLEISMQRLYSTSFVVKGERP